MGDDKSIETPEKGRKLDVAVSDARESLRSDIEANLFENLDEIIFGCNDKKIAYTQWSNEDLTDDQMAEVEEMLSSLDPSHKLFELLKDGDEDAKKILDAVVKHMKLRAAEIEESETEIQDLSTDVVTETMAGIKEKFGEKLQENWPGAIGFGAVAVIAGLALWQWQVKGHSVGKNLLFGGAFLWALNWGSTLLTPDGRSGLNYIVDFVSKNDGNLAKVLEGSIDEQAEAEGVDMDDWKRILKAGDIPFSAFLALYKNAEKRGDKEINMTTLRRTASQSAKGRSIPSKYLKDAYGGNMYDALHHMIGNDVEGFQGYADAGYSLTRVVILENLPYDITETSDSDATKKPGAIRRGLRRGTDWSKEKAAVVASACGIGAAADKEKKERSSRSDIELDLERDIPGFEDFGVKVNESKGSAVVMGFHFPTFETEETTDGTSYRFEGTDGEVFNFRASSSREEMEEDSHDLEKWLEHRMETLYEGTPDHVAGLSPEWDKSLEKWMADGVEARLSSDDETLELVRGESSVDVLDVPDEPFQLTDSFIDAKVQAIREEGAFADLMDNFKTEGPIKLSFWRTNRQWEQLVDFKRDQFLGEYEARLRELEGGTISPEELDKAYQETIGVLMSDFGLPKLHQEMVQASGDKKKQRPLVEQFEHFGYSPAYNDQFAKFEKMLKDKYDFKGWMPKSSDSYNDMLFELKRVWYENTKSFQNTERLSPSQRKYCTEVLEYQMRDILNDAQTLDPSFIQKLDSGISRKEFEALTEKLRHIPNYETWVRKEQIVDEVGESIPELAELGIARIETDETTGQKRVYLLDGGVFLVTQRDGETITTAIENLNMTTINNLVETKRNDAQFEQYFDELYNLYKGRTLGAGYYVTPILDFFDNVGENSWKSLVQYKKWEALERYRHDLVQVMEAGYSPGKTADEVDKLNQQFGILYLSETSDMATRVRDKVRDIQVSGKNPSKQQFRDWFTGLEMLGYSSDYGRLLEETRDRYDQFNYRGLESIGIRHPFDTENLAMRLIFRYTQDLNVDGSMSDREVEYFKYVRGRVDKMMLDALDNNRSASGTWFRTNIGRDEIPAHLDLDILDYSTWDRKHPEVPVDYTVAPPPPPEPEPEDPEAAERAELTVKFEAIKEKYWTAKIAKKGPDKINEVRVEEIEPVIDGLLSFYVESILNGSLTEEDALKDFKKDVKRYFKKEAKE